MNVLHLSFDAKVHVPNVQRLFEEAFPGRNRYWITRTIDGEVPEWLLQTPWMAKVVPADYPGTTEGKADLSWCDVLVVHYMDAFAGRIVTIAPPRVIVLWSGWGADYWDHIAPGKGLLLPETRALLPKSRNLVDRLLDPRGAWASLARTMRGRWEAREWSKKVVARVDLFSSPIPDDFELLRRSLPALNARYHQINYGSMETTFMGIDRQPDAQDVLVGNSATMTNNHLDIFSALRRLDLGDRRVVVPLGYGAPDYRESVLRVGTEYFGDRFMPLVEFVPLEEYKRILSRCSVVVMNHVRQQGLGNVNIMLSNGARACFRAGTPVHHFFGSRGAHVDTVESIQAGENSILKPLTSAQVQKNRKVLHDFWGHETVLGNIRALEEAARSCRGRRS